MYYQIAIDGCGGTGKSTVSKLLAKKLNFININTGIFFRSFTFYWLYKKEHNFEKLLTELTEKQDLIFKKNDVYYKKKLINRYLFDETITKNVFRIARETVVRDRVLLEEKKIAEKNNIIMEGRDIGSQIFPNAILKIFLTASLDTRSRRRYKQLKATNPKQNQNLEIIKKNLHKRDLHDQNRSVAPLIKCDDAIEIQTDNLRIDEVVDRIYQLFMEKKEQTKHV